VPKCPSGLNDSVTATSTEECYSTEKNSLNKCDFNHSWKDRNRPVDADITFSGSAFQICEAATLNAWLLTVDVLYSVLYCGQVAQPYGWCQWSKDLANLAHWQREWVAWGSVVQCCTELCTSTRQSCTVCTPGPVANVGWRRHQDVIRALQVKDQPCRHIQNQLEAAH